MAWHIPAIFTPAHEASDGPPSLHRGTDILTAEYVIDSKHKVNTDYGD